MAVRQIENADDSEGEPVIKVEELSDPASCMSKARDNEMTFVLLARDEAAPYAIRAWVEERVRLNKNKYSDPQIKDAIACADRMEAQRNGAE